jgi:hypothetical protein
METIEKVVMHATFFARQRRNKKVVGPTNICFLFPILVLLQAGENAYFSCFSLSLSSISLKPSKLLETHYLYTQLNVIFVEFFDTLIVFQHSLYMIRNKFSS